MENCIFCKLKSHQLKELSLRIKFLKKGLGQHRACSNMMSESQERNKAGLSIFLIPQVELNITYRLLYRKWVMNEEWIPDEHWPSPSDWCHEGPSTINGLWNQTLCSLLRLSWSAYFCSRGLLFYLLCFLMCPPVLFSRLTDYPELPPVFLCPSVCCQVVFGLHLVSSLLYCTHSHTDGVRNWTATPSYAALLSAWSLLIEMQHDLYVLLS